MLACASPFLLFALGGSARIPELPPLQQPSATATAASPEDAPSTPSDPAESGSTANPFEGIPEPDPTGRQDTEAGISVQADRPPPATPPAAELGSEVPAVVPTDRLLDLERPQRDGYVEVVAPRHRGGVMFTLAGISMGIAVGLQTFDHVACVGDCFIGISERVLLTGTMATATVGGALRGRADAYDDAAFGLAGKRVRTEIAVGGALIGLGVVAGIANDAVYWRCGPPSTACAPGRTRIILDTSAIAVAVGGALLAHGLRYRHDQRFYERARRVAVSPLADRNTAGLTIGGRF